jgi:hypothetical protein
MYNGLAYPAPQGRVAIEDAVTFLNGEEIPTPLHYRGGRGFGRRRR